ncbi:hypothetical protein B7C51_08155 [Paenibacillus larvae subsp. pulvifaciens]|uniref:Toxin-like protein n=1 Tax=Paenibacillus larvae subsp. pulvifaciens TaxID=1477 RepID=A0A1V0US65_9BACL|nr:binary toxin-like calcium binding domain-containing protein [Paenibacillus larvae]ARF67808.1 hypothetical protein B7C51_08155 [Paenibacillus larvae subsp. pulvifaciens]
MPSNAEDSKKDEMTPKHTRQKREVEEVMDTDDDGIYDSWEREGYTVINRVVVKWDQEKHKPLGYTKFVSDPNDAHTAGDPYTDYEKAAGIIDKAVSRVVLNPLVPAYPSIGVSMEKFIISKNKNVSEEEGKSLTISQGSSTTKSVDVGMNTSLHASLLDFGASVSASFHEGSSHTLSTEQGKGKSWSESIGLNTADSAYYNGNIRYFNRGTAPIYNAEPTTSLVLDTGKKAKTLFTVKAKENQKAQVVKPGDSYPRKGLAPISMRNMDDFGSTPIPLSYDQLNDLEKGTPLSLETDQFAGDYIKVINGNQSSPEPWTYWLTQIEQSSARLILNDGDSETERRIAARTAEGYDQETKPEVTLGEAMELTFGIPKSDKPAYKGDLIQYVFDENTAKEVKKQLKNMGDQADLQNVKLKAGMQVMLKTNLVHNGSFQNEFGDWGKSLAV